MFDNTVYFAHVEREVEGAVATELCQERGGLVGIENRGLEIEIGGVEGDAVP